MPSRLKEYASWYFRVCSPFEEGILRTWMGRTRWVGGEDGGFRKSASGGQPVGLPNRRGMMVFTA